MAERELPPDFHEFALRKPAGLCPVKGCRNASAKGARLCHKHRLERWRWANPVRAGWNTLRDHARARRIPFALTFDEFKELCELTNYIDEKGNTRSALQLDRIDPAKGYVAGNLRVVTTSENTAKGNTERWGAEYRKELLRRKGYVVEEAADPDAWIDPDSLPPCPETDPGGDLPF